MYSYALLIIVLFALNAPLVVYGDCDRHRMCRDISKNVAAAVVTCRAAANCFEIDAFDIIDCSVEPFLLEYNCYMQGISHKSIVSVHHLYLCAYILDCFEVLALSEGKESLCLHWFPKVVGTAAERHPYPDLRGGYLTK